ncbi:type II secretion system protein GspG [Myxococcus sp. K38C18041901]|uniref:type II secretion system protein GspG n=1 Tax=Myxococcus guangdongensis TaxID=2906760 RepID=UPI0020A6F651|nr:type II secretion system protein GspG [Myxococcus guangdongensis]MCP3063108.1 type II secretion system protein GspG [Myxococcus guangdongensis]
MTESVPRRPLSRALRQAGLALLWVAGLGGLVLFAMLLVSVEVCSEAARRDRAAIDLSAIQGALLIHQEQHRRLPTEAEGLKLLVEHQALQALPMDPWQNAYEYTVRDGQVLLRSLGADGDLGGEGSDADIELSFPVETLRDGGPTP